jgi:hypothetical protein
LPASCDLTVNVRMGKTGDTVGFSGLLKLGLGLHRANAAQK